MNTPKVSIITVCFNSAKTIARTIESVQKQSYGNIEHIFIDGKSTDGTLDIIRSLAPGARLVSEKDRGIYDAMNKGLGLASGDIIGTLNSDDFYSDGNSVQTIVDAFASGDIDYVCGRIRFIDPATNRVSHYFGAPPSLGSNLRYMTIAHPTIYVRREVLDTVGPYSLEYRISADFDWCLRLLQGKFRYRYIEGPFVDMSWGGQSSKDFMTSAREELLIKSRYFPDTRIKFLLQFYFYSTRRFLRILLIKAKLGIIVRALRTLQGKMD